MLKSLVPEGIKRRYRRLQFSLACSAHGVDISKVKFIGVTGTSGKTTTSSMVYHVLKNNGFKVGLISTVGAVAGDANIQTGFHVTTPDPSDLVKFIKQMIDQNIEYIVLETSSHALDQDRIGGIKFNIAIYTNITSDHLDWHKNWESYAKSKAKMIDRLYPNGVAIFNQDDAKSFEFLTNYAKKKQHKYLTYSLSEIEKKKESLEGVAFKYGSVNYEIKILGEYNISNALAVIKCAEYLEIENQSISKSFVNFKTVQGRMEIFQVEPFIVILDFAHNGDSLEQSLKTAKKLVKGEGRLISIFGSAGLRDVDKRAEMGRISGDIADITIVTSEDPRTEKLMNINSRILSGLEMNGPKFVRRFETHSQYGEFLRQFSDGKTSEALMPHLESDSGRIEVEGVFVFDEENVNSRFDAIDLAIRLAKKGDVVITNGKGHESSLAFGTIEYPFSDTEAIERALKASH